jgi:lysophospholipase L1-like esterase
MANYRYLALGDSYTIGESVEASLSFPAQLVKAIQKKTGISASELRIVAKTGWTTAELQAGIKKAKPKGPFDLVSLLIGVNNQYRHYEREIFSEEFGLLLDQAIEFAGGDASRVFVVGIPDYGCTPFGKEMASEIDSDLRWYNQEKATVCSERGIPFVDIYPESKRALAEPELLASDNLHPSAAMYALWVEKMLPSALVCLKPEKFDQAD